MRTKSGRFRNSCTSGSETHWLVFGRGLGYYYSMSKHVLHNEFTAIIEREEEWFLGYCPEIPGANGQGKNIEDCKKNLADAIALILEDRREDAARGLPTDAVQDIISIS